MSDQLNEPQDTAAPDPIAEPVVAAEPSALTSYVVLTFGLPLDQDAGEPSWHVVDDGVPARSAEAALRAYVEGNLPDGPVTLVAVPARSWRPQKITTKTTLVVEEAAAS